MDHLEQMTWKERIQYAIDKGDDLTTGECKWLEIEAHNWLSQNRILVRASQAVFNSVCWRQWQAALEALERIED